MNKLLSQLLIGIDFDGDIQKDSYNLLTYYGQEEVVKHSLKVANEAKKIAKKFGIDQESAFIAGCLHDISKVYSDSEKIEVAKALGIKVLKEEEEVPSLLHQKLSKIMAVEIFRITDEDILSAIECHTTLRNKVKEMDMILFVADKLQWDLNHSKGFRENVIKGLDISLEQAAFEYVNYMFKNKDNMKVVHPWMLGAYNYLKDRCVCCTENCIL